MPFLKVTFHLQSLQNIGYVPQAVQYILEPFLHPVVCTSHPLTPTVKNLTVLSDFVCLYKRIYSRERVISTKCFLKVKIQLKFLVIWFLKYF